MWETISAIATALGALLPLLWAVYEQYLSKKAEEKSRRASEDKAAHEARKSEDDKAVADGMAHQAQDADEDAWRAEHESSSKS